MFLSVEGLMSYFISAHVGDTLAYLFSVATDLDLGSPSSMTPAAQRLQYSKQI